jgi:Flp pilus assembly protein TadD
MSATPVPQPVHSSPGAVSAKRLRHHPPKTARKAYENAARLARKKNDGEAIQELQRAIAIDPDFAEAHGDLGVLYACLNRFPQAEAELRRAIELVPEESLPHSNLAWVLFTIGQRADAEASVRRALQLAPENVSARMLLGRLHIDIPK